MNDTLARLFAVAAGRGDPALCEDLLRPASAARQLAEEVGRLNAKTIDLRQIPGVADAIASDEWAMLPLAEPPLSAPAVPPLQSTGSTTTPTRPLTPSRLRLRRKGLIAATIAFLAIAGMSWGAWEWLAPKPLLQDTFHRPWFNSTLWTSERPIIKAEKGYLALINRGSFHSRQPFPEPFVLTFEWRWRDLTGYPHYSEDFAVNLRTTGRHAKIHAFDAVDGLVVRFHTYAGRISITSAGDHTVLASTKDAAFPIIAGQWHRIKITDDGDDITVYIDGPEIDRKYRSTPALQAHCPRHETGAYIAFFNREEVGGTPHESHIRNVAVWPLTKEKAP